ncbi:srg-29 [Pristionchus pacificus]|uniref:Serpentine receptor class gamma n=1 Tax=Pristionchus pacificus TaxID=54126 RepID=A0A2A6CUT6_PRIPA|nr:srg-29 [Pristionchus pacificus]|eukprot:PDM81992.1 srg-29 [Pristionchus pacificus]
MNATGPRCSATSSTDVELYIEFAIAIPSLVLYALFLLIYCRERRSTQLRSSYYLIFVVHSCINIVYFLSRALIMRISSFSFLCQWVLDSFGKFEYGFTPIYFIYHYTQHSQALSIIAININRVKIHHYSTHVLLLSIFIIPLPLTWHLLISPVKFITSPPMLGMDYSRIVTYPGLSILHLVVDGTATGVVAIASVAILAQLRALQNRKKTNERSMIIVSLLLSFGLLLSATVQYLIYTLPRTSDTYFFTLNRRWIVTNFVSLFPPWSLLLLSSVVRTEISVLLGRTPPPPCLSQGINNEDNWQEHYYDGLDTQRIHKNNDY